VKVVTGNAVLVQNTQQKVLKPELFVAVLANLCQCTYRAVALKQLVGKAINPGTICTLQRYIFSKLSSGQNDRYCLFGVTMIVKQFLVGFFVKNL